MLRKREDETLNARQFGTRDSSSEAMLAPDAERRLYDAYQAFFREADGRHWNLWTDLPWDDAPAESPGAALTAEVEALYRDLSFLPDYAVGLLSRLRSSRGRAWFATRWSYEEGKHLLTLHEWMVRRGVHAEAELKATADALLEEFLWTPPGSTVSDLLADALAWEIGEADRMARIRDLASACGDVALVRACEHIAADDAAHRGFLEEALRIVGESHPAEISSALEACAGNQAPAHVMERLASAIL